MAKGFKTGGRTKGTPNRASLDVKVLAQEYGPKAITNLAWLADHAESEQARVAANNAILDRGYGKPTQPISGDEENPLTVVHRIERAVIDGQAQLSSDVSPSEGKNNAR